MTGPDDKKIKVNIPTLSGVLPKRKKKITLEFGFKIEIVGLKFKKKGRYKFSVKFNKEDVGKITLGFGSLLNFTPVLTVTLGIREEARMYSDEQIKEFEKEDKVTQELKEALVRLQ